MAADIGAAEYEPHGNPIGIIAGVEVGVMTQMVVAVAFAQQRNRDCAEHIVDHVVDGTVAEQPIMHAFMHQDAERMRAGADDDDGVEIGEPMIDAVRHCDTCRDDQPLRSDGNDAASAVDRAQAFCRSENIAAMRQRFDCGVVACPPEA